VNLILILDFNVTIPAEFLLSQISINRLWSRGIEIIHHAGLRT